MIKLNRDRCPSCGKRLGEIVDLDVSFPLLDKIIVILVLTVILGLLSVLILDLLRWNQA